MSVISELVMRGHIKTGTWVGIKQGDHVTMMVVAHISDQGHIQVCDPRYPHKYQAPHELICEVDGMQLNRFLAQADLTPEGKPIQNLSRRGRKRKIRT